MNELPINLTDLVPKESSFTLEVHKDKEFKLCKWSLRVRAWATDKYTSEGLQDIFQKLKIGEIAEMTWFMLKDEDKKFFNDSKNDFLDAVCSVGDQVNIIKALLGAVGIGEPEIKKIDAALKKKESTGAPAKNEQENWGEIYDTIASRYAWCSPEAFGDLTMRQVLALLKPIGKAQLVEFYNQMLSYRIAKAEEFPSLEEFLTLTSKNADGAPKMFDDKADKFLEEQALAELNRRKQLNG